MVSSEATLRVSRRGGMSEKQLAMFLRKVSIILTAICLTAGVARAETSSVPNVTLIQSTPPFSFGLVWNQDSTRIAGFTGVGKEILVWDRDGNIVREFQHPDSFYIAQQGLGFVDHSQHLVSRPVAATDDLLFSVLGITSGKTVQQVVGPHPDNNKPQLLAVSPDQSVIAVISGAEMVLRLYSGVDFNLITVLSDSAYMPLGGIIGVTFASDSKTLAIGRGDGSVAVYDLLSKKVIHTFRTFDPPMPIMAIGMSPDAQYVVVSTTHPGYTPNSEGVLTTYALPDRVRVYRVSDGVLVASNSEAPYAVYHLSWGGRQNLIAFISGDLGEIPSLHLWNPWQHEPDKIVPTEQEVTSLISIAISPDGSRMAVGTRTQLNVYKFDDNDQ